MFVIVAKVRGHEATSKNSKLTKKIDSVIMNVNKMYSSDFHESFHRIDNHSFEGVLYKGIYVLEIIDKLKYGLDVYDVGFGVGFCEGDVENNSIHAIEQGKVNAYQALERLEENSDYGNAHIQVSLGRQNSLENIINASLRTTDFIESRWRLSQHDLVKYLVLNYGFMENFVQKDVARDLKLSAQNFNQQLKNSGYFNILKLKREITVIIEQYRRSQHRN